MNTRNKIWWSILLTIVLGVSSCSNDENMEEVLPNPRVDIQMNESESSLANQHIDFSIKLLHAAEEVMPNEEQLVISPLSTSFALAMILNGATGTTQQEIMNVLGCNGFTIEEINEFNQKLITELPNLDNTATVGLANSLWLNADALDSYKNLLRNYYQADVYASDFSSSKTLNDINEWCADKSNNLIPSFYNNLDAATKLLLLNVMYFNANWKSPFDKDDNTMEVFTTISGIQQTVEFMSKEDKLPIAMAEQYTMTELDYGNEAYSMVILLPNEGTTLTECLANLDSEKWMENIASLEKNSMMQELKLPKFTVENKSNLTSTLQKMGIVKAFEETADFENLTTDKFYISGIQQGQFIKVDENGTEASTVTGIDGILDSRYRTFHVNRPFLFAIKEKSTNTILFLGRMNAIP